MFLRKIKIFNILLIFSLLFSNLNITPELSKDDFIVTTTISGIIITLFFGAIAIKSYSDFQKKLASKMDEKLTDLGLTKTDVSSLKNSIKNDFGQDQYNSAIRRRSTIIDTSVNIDQRITDFSEFINNLPIQGSKGSTSKAYNFLTMLNTSQFENKLFSEKDLLAVMEKSGFTTKDISDSIELMQARINITGSSKLTGVSQETLDKYTEINNKLIKTKNVNDFNTAYKNNNVDGMVKALKNLQTTDEFNDFNKKLTDKAIIFIDNAKSITERDTAYIDFINLINNEMLKKDLIKSTDTTSVKNLLNEYYKSKSSFKPFFDVHTEPQLEKLESDLTKKSADQSLAEALSKANAKSKTQIDQIIKQSKQSKDIQTQMEQKLDMLEPGDRFELEDKYYEKTGDNKYKELSEYEVEEDIPSPLFEL